MKLTEAVEAANERKQAVGLCEPGDAGLVFSSSSDDDKAVFSGFNVEYDELLDIISRASWFFTHMAPNMGLRPLFAGCWADGLLVGLIMGRASAQEDKCKDDG